MEAIVQWMATGFRTWIVEATKYGWLHASCQDEKLQIQTLIILCYVQLTTRCDVPWRKLVRKAVITLV